MNTPRRPRSCEICFEQYVPTYYEQRTCGRTCGWILRRGGLRSVVRWTQCGPCGGWQTTKRPHRHAPVAPDRAWMNRVIECPVCGVEFTNQFTTTAVHCSPRCSRKANKLRRKVRECGSNGTWRWSDFMRIAARFDYCCAYCGVKPDRLDPDHVIPLAKRGPNTTSNLLPACRTCNEQKTDFLLHEWAAHRARKGLPPRRTEWDDDDARYFHLTALRSTTTTRAA